MQMQKLNTLGEPASSGQNVVSILYGHGNKGGKVYSYLAPAGVRTGDIVTPEVTHPKSGKNYKTMGKVMNRRDASNSAGQNIVNTLDNQGVQLKTLGSTDVRSLPGFSRGVSQGKFSTAKGWANESASRHSQQRETRFKKLDLMGNSLKGAT